MHHVLVQDSRHFQSIQKRHFNVADYQIRTKRFRLFQKLLSV